MKIDITLWAGNLVPTDGEHDLDRMADDFAAAVLDAVKARHPLARVTVRVDDGEGLETAIRISPAEGAEAEQAESDIRELITDQWERFDFDAYAPVE